VGIFVAIGNEGTPMCAKNQTAIGESCMWLAGGYFDESFDECEDRCYTIAGYIGPQLPAVILDLRWKDLLKHYNMAYFKCSELEFGFGEFAQYRDDPSNMQAPLSAQEKAKIREIKTAFVCAWVS